MTLSFTALLLATCPFIAEGFGTIPDSVIYFHVTLNLIISGTGLFIIKPFARIADRIIPEKKADAKTGGEAADLFAKENLISSGMSLNVARTELQRITGDVRSFWHDIEIMLRINPADGEILILHDRGNYIDQRTSAMTRYLGLVMRGQLTTAEAIERQYLKNANGSIKVALNTIDRIITVIMNEKCRKNRSFTPDGLKEQLRRLAAMGPDRVVITSAPATRPGYCAAVAYDREQGRFWKMESPYIPAFYPGTGDTFSSVLVGAFLQGDSLPVALERAARFVTLCIRGTYCFDTRHSDGVLLERTLPALQDRCAIGEYEAF